MSLPRVISELVVTGIRVLGKATAAAGAQAVRNFKHKPEGAPSAGPVGTGSSKSQITNALQMSVEEARLILNVKKDDPMEIIQKNYDAIFAANGPPPPSTESAPAQAGPSRRPPPKGPVHSHYLQSKVFRALERIKAERGELESGEAGVEGQVATGPTTAGAASAATEAGAASSGTGGAGGVKPGAGIPPEGSTVTPPPPPPPPGSS